MGPESSLSYSQAHLAHKYFRTFCFSRGGVVSTSPDAPSRRTTPCRLSATVYSIYSQLPYILEAVPPSANWRRAMPWWQGPTNTGIAVNSKYTAYFSSIYISALLVSYRQRKQTYTQIIQSKAVPSVRYALLIKYQSVGQIKKNDDGLEMWHEFERGDVDAGFWWENLK